MSGDLDAQTRLRYEYIDKFGNWQTNTGSWAEATEVLLSSWRRHYDKESGRADRRNWRVEFRRFSKQVHQMDVEGSWTALNQLIAEVVDPPNPIRVVITGNPLDGFSIFGPFDDFESATAFGESLNEEWWTAHVGRPE